MDKFEYYNQLLPFYSDLLTQRQKEIMEMYFFEDLSLTEIAENLQISRNAVYDTIKKGENLLKEYEKSEEKFDVIILDPTAYTKTAKNFEIAYGG